MNSQDNIGMDADIVIIGGGIAGCALAYVLAPHHRVLVLEKERESTRQNRIGESLPAAALRLLNELGLESALEQTPHHDYHGVVSVWGQKTPIRKDFFETLDGIGRHLDRDSFNRAIKQLARAAGIRFRHECQLKGLKRIDQHWQIEFGNVNETLKLNTKFIVDASGRANVVARKLKIKPRSLDRAVAIYAYCPTLPDYDDTQYKGITLIEATQDGWWYRAPLPGGSNIVSFHTDSDLAITHDMQKPDFWRKSLYLTELVSTGIDIDDCDDLILTVCAANSSMPVQTAGDGWLAIGDAAVAFDPISSQGMFNALATALIARDTVKNHFNGNQRATGVYRKKIDDVYRAYRHSLNEFYQVERRWSDHPFWRRRHKHGTGIHAVNFVESIAGE